MAEKGERMRINVVKVEKSKYYPQRSAVEVHISTAWCSFVACQLINEQREAHNEQNWTTFWRFSERPLTSLPSLPRFGKICIGKRLTFMFFTYLFLAKYKKNQDQRRILTMIL